MQILEVMRQTLTALCVLAVDKAHTVCGGDSADVAGVSSAIAHGGRPSPACAAGASGLADGAGSPPGLAAATDGSQRGVRLHCRGRAPSNGHRDLAGAGRLCFPAADAEPERLGPQLQEGQLLVGIRTRHAARCVPAQHTSCPVGQRTERRTPCACSVLPYSIAIIIHGWHGWKRPPQTTAHHAALPAAIFSMATR